MSKRKILKEAGLPGGTEPYIHLPGMPFNDPVDGVLRNKADLPFVCRRCLHPLQANQRHTLHKTGRTPVICLGTCLDAIRGNPEALAELELTSSEEVWNAYSIPDPVVAKALSYDLEKGETIDATYNVASGTLISEGSEETGLLDQRELHGQGLGDVRDGGSESQAA